MSLEVLTMGGGGESASIFITGLSESDIVTAEKDGKTINGRWTQKPNPALRNLPDGYTQLEYIESTGKQRIDTGFVSTSRTEIDVTFAYTSTADSDGVNGTSLFGTGVSGVDSAFLTFYPIAGEFTCHLGAVVKCGTTDTNKHNIVYNDSENRVIFDGVVKGTLNASSYSNSRTLHLFFINQSNIVQGASAKIYAASLRENGVLVRDYVPCVNPSGVLGLYDLVNGVFYANAGTGDFIAGGELPKHIYGHSIVPIKSYGMWTVTATNGVETKTQDVLVDSAMEYEIEMAYILWLYRDGDECEEVTGGWISQGLGYSADNNVPDAPTLTKNATNMVMSRTGTTDTRCGAILPKNKIDFTAYKTINAIVDAPGAGTYWLVLGRFRKDNIGSVCMDSDRWFTLTYPDPAVTNKTVTGDISTHDGLYVPYIALYSVASLTIHKVWLE